MVLQGAVNSLCPFLFFAQPKHSKGIIQVPEGYKKANAHYSKKFEHEQFC